MKKYLFAFIATLALAIQFTVQGIAAEFKPFDRDEFNRLMQEGKPILIDAYADWCPTCKRQLKILDPIIKEVGFSNFTAFKIDYDTDKQTLKDFGIHRQSTLVLLNQGKEVRRSIAETDATRLREFITLP